MEESIIDFVLMSDDLLEHCESLLIDEKRDHILTKIIKTKKGVKKVVSDHNVLISKFKLVWRKTKNAKIETFNFKNKDCQLRFKELTSSTVSMSSIFDTKDDLNMATKHFIKRLNGFIHEAFRKVRISDRKNSEIDKLFERRRVLRRKNDQESREELEKVEEELANKCAEENYAKIMEEIKGIDCNEGGVHSGKLWSLRRKLCPKSRDPPTAMLDPDGNMLTSSSAIQNLAVNTYKERLKNRKIKYGLEDIQIHKEELCKERIKVAEKQRLLHGLWMI